MLYVYLISLAVFAKSAEIVNFTTTSSPIPTTNTEETLIRTNSDISDRKLSSATVTETSAKDASASVTSPEQSMAASTTSRTTLSTASTTTTASAMTIASTTSTMATKDGNVHNRNHSMLAAVKVEERNVSISYDAKHRSKLEKKNRMEQHRLDKLARERRREEARAKIARERAEERQRRYRTKEKSKLAGRHVLSKSKYTREHKQSKKMVDNSRKYPYIDVKDRNRPVKKVCVECEKRLEKEQRENNRKASLKKQIVDKLRIDPSLSVRRPVVPPEILRRSMMDDESNNDDDGFAQTTDIMVFGHDITRRCRYRKSTGCFKFHLRNKIAGRVISAELFVYKLHDPNDGQQSIFLSELERPKFSKLMPRNILARVDTDLTEGWLKFRLDKTVQKWVEKPNTNDGIAVKCKTCARHGHKKLYSAKEGYKPVLIVHIQPPSKRRQKRDVVECGADVNGCCKHNFWVDFDELNLIQVLYPGGMWANYCTGTCSVMNDGQYNHADLLQDIRYRSETANSTIRDAITSCCGAVRLKPISVLYADDEGDIRHADVPDLAVEECGCL